MEKYRKDIPEDYNVTQPGRYLIRMEKDKKSGMYKDEIRRYKSGKPSHLVVFPYTIRRSERHDFREMNSEEITEYNRQINGKDAKPTYAMLERRIKMYEEEENLRKALIAQKRKEFEAEKKAQANAKLKAEAVKPEAAKK